VPGDRPDRFGKALASGADMVILDLEDGVAPANKQRAREAIASSLTQEHSICLRINSTDTDWFEGDLELCSMAGISSIMLPKAENMDQVQHLTGRVAGNIPVLPFIETALGYWNMRQVADCPGVQRLVFGTLDFLLDLGMSAQADELNSVRLQMVLVSRLAGIASPVEGVTQELEDSDLLQHDSQRARKLGFGGKLCIHPVQVPVINRCFSYSDEEIAWARKVVMAAEQTAGAVMSIDGKMVDKPVIERARLILEQAGE